MKKIMIFLILVFLVACNNPFKKYEESGDKLQEALSAVSTIETQISTIEALINGGDLSNANITDVYAALQTINDNLGNEIVQSVLSNYAEQNGINLDTDIDAVQAQILADPGYVNYTPAPGEPSKAEVTALLTSILGKI